MEKDDHLCSACDNVKQERNKIVCECACMQVPVISHSHTPQQTTDDSLGWRDSVNNSKEKATSSLLHEAPDKKQQSSLLQTESFETVSSHVMDPHSSLYLKNSFKTVNSHFKNQHNTPCLTNNLGTASSHLERQNSSTPLKNGPKTVHSNRKDPNTSRSASSSCKYVESSTTKRSSSPKTHPTPGGLGVHVRWESEHRVVQGKETEVEGDVVLLHLPVVIVCVMIVCITLSSCIMGYI